MNKKRLLVASVSLVAGVAILLLGCKTVQAIPERDISNEKTVVYEMYTFQCERCGYLLAEGEFGYIEYEGWERCNECNMYREIGSPRD